MRFGYQPMVSTIGLALQSLILEKVSGG